MLDRRDATIKALIRDLGEAEMQETRALQTHIKSTDQLVSFYESTMSHGCVPAPNPEPETASSRELLIYSSSSGLTAIRSHSPHFRRLTDPLVVRLLHYPQNSI